MKFSYNGNDYGEKCSTIGGPTPPVAGASKPLTARQELNARKFLHMFLRPMRSVVGMIVAIIVFAIQFEHCGHWLLAFLTWLSLESAECLLWENILPVRMLDARKWLLIPEIILEYVLIEILSVVITVNLVQAMIADGAFG